MTAPRGDDAPTVIVRAGRHRPRRRWIVPASLVILVGAAGMAGALLLRPGAPAPPLADEAAIVADRPAALAVFRLAVRPAVVVLDFPDADAQGATLDRVAAFIEKKGLPHDRVLDDAALARAIRADGDTPATWYSGHDYSAPDLARFFRTADADGVALDADEQHLRRLAAGWAEAPAGFGAVITIAAGAGMDRATRAVILHHEVAHGFYFTDPAYVAAIRLVWCCVMTGGERDDWTAYLAQQEYDPTLTDLMRNEMQAYIGYTPPGRFFDPAATGIAPERVDAIRAAVRAAAPAGLTP